MKKYSKRLIISLFAIFMTLIGTSSVYAASASINVSGGSLTQGEQIRVNISVGGVNTSNGRVYSLGGSINYDSSFLSGSCSSTGSLSGGSVNGRTIGVYDASYSSGVGGGATLVTCTFTALKPGTTSVTIYGAEMNDVETNSIGVSVSPGTINIAPPKSGNNDLSSLSVSGCNIGFSAGNTNYSCNVDSNVTSANISASPADGKASVSGVGAKNLNYGANKFAVTVTAENGAQKNYNITINRKDNRSGENALASLTCSNCTLSPGFSSGNTKYTTSVEYAVSSLNLKYTAKDAKATVRVSNNSLTAEETTNVTITVTAENGSTKTYTIAATRGKDPNKVLSKDNNLLSLAVDQGMLSPAFSPEQTNYGLYLPYEISKINITYDVSDKRYATVNFNGPEELGVGNNVYTIAVKAESNEEKVYTITVVRAKSLVGDASTNALLASLKLKNGSLTTGFDSGIHLYYYNQNAKKDVVIDAIAQDKEAVVTYLEAGSGVYAVLVTAPSGNSSIYIMLPENKKSAIIFIIIAAIALLLGIILFIIKIVKSKKNKSSNSEEHKDNKKNKKDKNKKSEEEE